jgi:hypothetical protein
VFDAVGYGPIVDIYLPTTGTDGSVVGPPFDGISLSGTTASVIGRDIAVGAKW